MSALAAVNAGIVRARGRVAEAEATIERLRQVIDDEAPAAEAIQSAVAADGGAGLSRFAAGKDGDLAEMVTRSEQATRAALVAKAALPRAEQEFREAIVETETLIAQRAHRVAAVLIEQGDAVAKEYVETFKALCRLHDQISGIAQAVTTMVPLDIVLVNAVIEAPRFGCFPALKGGTDFSPFMRHVPIPARIEAAKDQWAERARQLAADPE
jgi:hypothetical protein